MIWEEQALAGAPVETAFDPDTSTLEVGHQRLRVVSDNPVDVRAVGPDGSAYRLSKRGLTVSHYEAVCGGRHYTARRAGGRGLGKRREIRDASGRLVAVTRGLPNGDLEVELPAGEGFTLDVAFVSWALLLVDAPVRRTLY